MKKVIEETYSNDMDEKFWSNQWGDKIFFGHGKNRSAGIAFFFSNLS